MNDEVGNRACLYEDLSLIPSTHEKYAWQRMSVTQY